jgi:TolA-binding protein
MAQKLGILNQWFWGEWADRAAINRNAEDLSTVEAEVGALRTLVQRQAQDILRLRAMLDGVVDLLHDKLQLDEAELRRSVEAAWEKLNPPPPEKPVSPVGTDPYRGGTAGEPTVPETDAAKALLATAQSHHFSRRFAEARDAYQQIVDGYPATKQAATARQQLDNLKKA